VSDNWLRIIPTEPEWVPPVEARFAALETFRRLVPNAEEVEELVYDSVEFIDQGANFEKASCPRCGAVLSTVAPDVHDHDGDWLWATFDAGYDRQSERFTTLRATTPCCRVEVSLNDLIWDWPAGFARYELSAMNPDRDRLSLEEVAQLQAAMGHPVREIWQHI
jgi:hypothetical protein